MTLDWFVSAAVLLLAVLLGSVFTALWLELARRWGLSSGLREDLPESHKEKAGTPSMGGIGILAAVLVAAVLAVVAVDSATAAVPVVAAGTVLFGMIGLWDDRAKQRGVGAKGIKARHRIIIELALGMLFTWLLVTTASLGSDGGKLGFGSLPLPLHILLGALVIAGSANAVNLTDGLDGLAGGTCALAGLAMACVCWIIGLPTMALLCLCVAGAAAGFLWFNCKPAAVWMGDVGSLGLGGALGLIAVAAGIEWVFAVIAAVFVVEVVSVILQVTYFKATGGKRLFPMTPIHHSFELMGWQESKIVVRFWLLGTIAGLLGVCVAAFVVGGPL